MPSALRRNADYWTGLSQPKPLDIDDLIVWVALGVVLGGRIGYVLFYNLGPIWRSPWRSSRSGTAACRSMAALLGAVAGASCCLPGRRGLNPLAMLDMAAVVDARSAFSSGASPISSTANCGAGRRPIFPTP